MIVLSKHNQSVLSLFVWSCVCTIGLTISEGFIVLVLFDYSAGDGVTFPTRTIDLDSDGLLADRQRWMEEGELESHLNNGRVQT